MIHSWNAYATANLDELKHSENKWVYMRWKNFFKYWYDKRIIRLYHDTNCIWNNLNLRTDPNIFPSFSLWESEEETQKEINQPKRSVHWADYAWNECYYKYNRYQTFHSNLKIIFFETCCKFQFICHSLHELLLRFSKNIRYANVTIWMFVKS